MCNYDWDYETIELTVEELFSRTIEMPDFLDSIPDYKAPKEYTYHQCLEFFGEMCYAKTKKLVLETTIQLCHVPDKDIYQKWNGYNQLGILERMKKLFSDLKIKLVIIKGVPSFSDDYKLRSRVFLYRRTQYNFE